MPDNETLSIFEVHILDVCCKIEETCASIYRYFSKLYEDTPKTRALWVKTAMEEESHAEQFRLASRLRGSGMGSLKTDIYNTKLLLAKIQSIYDGVQKSPPPLKESLRFAIKMEQAMAVYHMNSIIIYKDENLERLFKSMMGCDKQHIKMLENAFNELCNDHGNAS